MTKSLNITPKLGEGVFLPMDVAQILNLPYPKVYHWIRDFWGNYTFGEKRNKAVNFHTLIEFYIYYQLRLRNISPQKIKAAHKTIAQDLKTAFPFAHSEISTIGKDIWYERLGVILKADGSYQLNIQEFIKPFLKKIEFDKNNVAKRYFPLEKSKEIVVDPSHQFGLPTITGTNIQAKAILNLYKSGEQIESIRGLYDLTERQVKDAILFYNKSAA